MKSRVLLIDDEVQSRVLTSYLLKSFQVEIDQVEDFEGALAHILNKKADIIVLDWRLSDKTGGDILRIINTLHVQKNSTAVILYTGVKFNELNFPRIKEFPLVGYISKNWPINTQRKKLNSIIKTVLGGPSR